MEERVCLKSLKEQSRELHMERLDKLQSQEGNFVFSLIEAFRSLSSSSCYESVTSFREIESRESSEREESLRAIVNNIHKVLVDFPEETLRRDVAFPHRKRELVNCLCRALLSLLSSSFDSIGFLQVRFKCL